LEEPRTYIAVVEQDEDGVYIATIPALPGVVEQGDTEEEALKRVIEAGTFTLNSMAEDGEEIPPSDVGSRVVREIVLAV
jgi:predicted RNase H-like HicB family nuclease